MNILISLLLLLTVSFSNNNNLTSYEDALEINVIEQNENYVIINYQIHSYDIQDIEYENEIFQDITLDGEPDFIIKGAPKLPHINRSDIIPDNSSANIIVLESEYIDIENINVIPSKGNPSRNIDIKLIPYIKGKEYTKNEFFPSDAS